MALWKGRFLERYRRAVIMTAACAIATGLVGTQLRHVQITIMRGTQDRTISEWTFHRKVEGALYQSEITVTPQDFVEPSMTTLLERHSIVTVRQAIPVTVNTPHHHQTIWTSHSHVRGLLAALRIKIGPLDQVSPALNAALQAHDTVNVIRRWYQQRVQKRTIPFKVDYQPNPNRSEGSRTVVRAGRDGIMQIVSRVLVADGTPVSAVQTVSQKVTPPVNEVVQYGTQPLVARGAPNAYDRTMNVVATAYWPDPSWSTGYTATGVKAQYGVVAVDPSVIPLGARLYIPGYGYAVAADTGGAIIGNRIDLCYDTASQAEAFGVRSLQIDILSM